MDLVIESNEKGNEAVKRGIVKRVLTAVLEKAWGWMSQNQMGMSPYDSSVFMRYTGIGWEEGAYFKAMVQSKQEAEV